MNRILKHFRDVNLSGINYLSGLNPFEKLTDIYIKSSIFPEYPMFLNLFITSQCNGKCMFCSADSRIIEWEEDIINPFLKARLEELKEEQSPVVISLCGGEPLLYPKRCKGYLDLFKETNTIFCILSNLSLDLNTERLNLLSLLKYNPFSYTQTSIDSLKENEHMLLRQGTNLKKILSNIKLLQENNIKIKINTTVSEYNYKNIMDIVRYAYNEGIESMHINHVLPFGRAKNLVNDKLIMDVIYSVMEVAASREFNSIKDHTITFPSEAIPLSFIGSRNEDILEVYGNGNGNSEKYISSKFICNLSHENNYCSTGWVNDTKVPLDKKTIIEAYRTSNVKDVAYFDEFCKKCSQFSNCNQESFYTGSCLMIDLYNRIQNILEYKIKPTYEENMRLRILYELEKRSEEVYEVILSVTNECNGNCNFCQVNGSHKDTCEVLDIENIIKFLKGDNYSIQITGGEPLVRKNETGILIKKLKEDGHIISLLTNAVLIDDSFINILKNSFTTLDVVQISVYAHNSDLHNTISGRDDWEHLNKIIKQLINSGIQVRANLTLTNDNLEFIDEIYFFYKNLGLNQISVNGLLKKGRAYDIVNEKYILNYIYYIQKFLKNKSLKGLLLSIPVEVIKTYSNIKNNFDVPIINKGLVITEKNKSICINSDGFVYSPITGEKICSVYDTKLSSIKLLDVKRELYNSECKQCHGFSICKGQCIYEQVLDKYGNLNYSYCDLYKLDEVIFDV